MKPIQVRKPMPLTMSERLEMIHEAYCHSNDNLHKLIVEAYTESLKEELAYGRAIEARVIERTSRCVPEVVEATEFLDEYLKLVTRWM